MVPFMIMKATKITSGGQISVPAEVRRRWNTSRVQLEDLGDRLVIHPAPDDPIGSVRGALMGLAGVPTEELRARARGDEAKAESRRSER